MNDDRERKLETADEGGRNHEVSIVYFVVHQLDSRGRFVRSRFNVQEPPQEDLDRGRLPEGDAHAGREIKATK